MSARCAVAAAGCRSPSAFSIIGVSLRCALCRSPPASQIRRLIGTTLSLVAGNGTAGFVDGHFRDARVSVRGARCLRASCWAPSKGCWARQPLCTPCTVARDCSSTHPWPLLRVALESCT